MIPIFQLTDDQFKLSFVKGLQVVQRNDLVEASLQRQELLLNAATVSVVDVQLDVLLLVVLSHRDLLSARLELVQADGAVGSVLDGKRRPVQNPLDVVAQDPLQRAVEVRIDAFDVVQIDVFVEKHLVEGHGEAAVDVVAVENSHADDPANKVEVRQVVRIDS